MIVIGEKINATRKSISKAILSKDKEAIQQQIQDQDNASAKYIDLNAGTGTSDADQEIKDMYWLIDIALETTEKKLSIDSENTLIVQKAAEYLSDKRPWMLNSVKYDENVLNKMLPLAAERGADVIALSMDTEGIPETSEKRIDICKRIYEKAEKAGVKPDRMFFDPLVIPVSSNYTQGGVTLNTLQRIKNELPDAKTTMGLSNVSFGLKKRFLINQTLLIASIAHGLDSAICDPTKDSIQKGIILGELIAGRDRHCRRFTRAYRHGLFDKKK